jgi:hypothetical protein
LVEERAEEAEKAATRGDLNTVYKITKELSGKASQIPSVKDEKVIPYQQSKNKQHADLNILKMY